MVRRKIDACRQDIIHITDHAGRPARLLWCHSRHEVLIPLASICFYFVHPSLNLDDFNFNKFRDDVLHNADDWLQLRVDIFFIPGGTDADCIEHYRKELKYRGDVLEQIREVQEARASVFASLSEFHESQPNEQ